MAVASGVSFRFRAADLPVLEEARPYVLDRYACGGSKRNVAFGRDRIEIAASVSDFQRTLVHDVQTSGGILMAVPPERSEAVLRDLHEGGDPWAREVGEILPKGPPVVVA